MNLNFEVHFFLGAPGGPPRGCPPSGGKILVRISFWGYFSCGVQFWNSRTLLYSSKVKKYNKTYYTQREPVDTEIPLVVLVDGKSASASEIVSGALQDMDRAVVVGTRSFGKGLVQRPKPLTYGTQMKITISRYYTPSGRCIQALDYWNRDENGNATENPSLADCMNTILRDRNTFDRNDKMFYFFELMVLQFFKKSVQRMIISDNSVPPMPDDFNEKLHTAIDNFKSCGEG